MYAFLDQPIARLGDGSRFVLWAMRGWIHAIEQGVCPSSTLYPPFRKMDALAALPHLHMTLTILNRCARERLVFANLSWARITEDEAVLLQLWQSAANRDHRQVNATLTLLVEDDAVAVAEEALMNAAGILSVSGLAPNGLAFYSASSAFRTT